MYYDNLESLGSSDKCQYKRSVCNSGVYIYTLDGVHLVCVSQGYLYNSSSFVCIYSSPPGVSLMQTLHTYFIYTL